MPRCPLKSRLISHVIVRLYFHLFLYVQTNRHATYEYGRWAVWLSFFFVWECVYVCVCFFYVNRICRRDEKNCAIDLSRRRYSSRERGNAAHPGAHPMTFAHNHSRAFRYRFFILPGTFIRWSTWEVRDECSRPNRGIFFVSAASILGKTFEWLDRQAQKTTCKILMLFNAIVKASLFLFLSLSPCGH